MVTSLIIGAASKFTIDQLFRYARFVICFALISSLLLIYFLSFWNRKEEGILSAPETHFSDPAANRALSYGAIGTEALALNSAHLSSFSPNLSEEILILARNSRPDVHNKEASILIRLKTSQQERLVWDNTPIFLNCQTNEEGNVETLSFSAEPTSLWIKPVVLDNDRILIEMGKGEDKGQFVVQASAELGARARTLMKGDVAYIQNLKQAKCWGFDTLMQHYGGEEYKSLQGKQKIEFPSLGGVCFVGAGDYLVWDRDRWQMVPFEKIPRDLPIAHVKSVSSKGVEIEAWDASGFQMARIKLEPEHANKLNYKMENLPSSIRIRTSTQVTCALGRRRLILREGDWLLRTSNGWRNLRKLSEIEDCIQHKIRGELFIFDNLEKEQGRVTLKGHLFDEMRTQIQPIAIPIVIEKKAAAKNK